MKNMQRGIRILIIVSAAAFCIECKEKNISGTTQTTESVQHTKSQQETMPIITENGTQAVPVPDSDTQKIELVAAGDTGTYSINTEPSEGGRLVIDAPAGGQKITKDSAVTFKALPDTGYEIAMWDITGGEKHSGGNPGDETVTVKLTSDIIIKVSFKENRIKKYTVTLQQTEGGKLKTEGIEKTGSVEENTDVTFTAVPLPKTHKIGSWSIKGGEIRTGGGNGDTTAVVRVTGNVWEWCWDLYNGLSPEGGTNPLGSKSGTRRAARGGSWGSGAGNTARACRLVPEPTSKNCSIGLRMVYRP